MRQREILLASFAILILSAAALPADEKPQLTGAEIISKHLQAVGGKEALSKINLA